MTDQPVCQVCNSLLRRDLNSWSPWWCDLHGPQPPRWITVDPDLDDVAFERDYFTGARPVTLHPRS
jgi:hypothetical protein